MVVITGFRRDIVIGAVQRMYSEVAASPERGFHFPTGTSACTFVGYPDESLASLPQAVVESFAGVGYPFAADVVRAGDVVLDVGSGSGTDVFLASRLVGPTGKVYALDMTEAMRTKLQLNLAAAGIDNVEVLDGEAESIPLPDEAVDAVTSNGVLNLVVDKPRAVQEIARVLRPGGRIQIADIVVGRSASDACRSNPELWAECIVGATTESAYLEHFRDAGFGDIEVLARLDYFARSSPETRDVARSLDATAITLRAVRTHERAAAGSD